MNQFIHFVDKVLDHLTPYIPLMQSIVWPLVVMILLVVFRGESKKIIKIIIDRLESGSAVEAGPFKLGEKLAAPTPEEVEEKRKIDSSETEGQLDEPKTEEKFQPSKGTVVRPGTGYLSKKELSRFYRIENAALSRLSMKLGIPITREVKPNSDSRIVFDGVALDTKAFRIIEVKIIKNIRVVKTNVRHFLDAISSFCLTLEDNNRDFVRVVLVIVIARDFEGDSSSIGRLVASTAADYTFPVLLEQFTENELLGEEDAQPTA